MRRQTTATGGASAGSSREPRLDPTALPLRYSARIDERGQHREATIFLDRDRAIVKSRSSIGAPLTVCLPVTAFDGVAVRMTAINEDGYIEVVVELRHRDPALSLPLVVADDPADVADDWRSWGEALNLPLLLVELDGCVTTVDQRASGLGRSPSQPRRHHSFFADRRPRFLARRKRGRAATSERVVGREIIARD